MVPKVRGREGKTFGDEDTFIEITSSGFFIFHSRCLHNLSQHIFLSRLREQRMESRKQGCSNKILSSQNVRSIGGAWIDELACSKVGWKSVLRLMGLGWDYTRLHETSQKEVYAWVKNLLLCHCQGALRVLLRAELTCCLHKVMTG